MLTKKSIYLFFPYVFTHAVETGRFTFYFWEFVMSELKNKGVKIRKEKLEK